VAAVGVFTNRLLLAGIALEVAMIALLAYTPGVDRLFHTSDLEAWHWLFLLLWPPVVLGAEEIRKASVRRRLRRRAIVERSP
jgi:Ca2+-transporting ATPase